MSRKPPQRLIVFYDGECVLCNRAIRIVLRADCKDVFRITPLQSAFAQHIIHQHPPPLPSASTILLWDQHQWYVRSSAILQICKHLCKGWSILYIFRLIPRPLRDALYQYISQHRYRWFGKYPHCPLPDPVYQHKFLE
ncbi:MAG: DUF393 domain-containing protein [Thermoflavifilum sp.]|nr:DUF393 domain-containing protein [Thermoflavifilum sp.]